MAKVYDALKRVQEQRSRQAGASSEGLSPPEVFKMLPTPAVRRRWFASWTRAAGQSETTRSNNNAIVDQVEGLLHRLDRLEQHASTNLPAVERHVVEAIDARLRTLEQELTARMAELLAEHGRRAERLSARVSLVIGLLTLLCLAAFFRR